MKRYLTISILGLLLCAPGAGCASTSKPEPGVRPQANAEPNALRQQLARERSRSAALQAELDDTVRKWKVDQAELNMRRSHAEQSSRADELAAQMRQRDEELAERPAVAPSPLPPKLDQALLSFAERNAQAVSYNRQRGGLSLLTDQLFETGSDTMTDAAAQTLRELGRVLAGQLDAQHEVIVVGHSDGARITRPETLARHPSNWHLSVHRALTVKDMLTTAGVRAGQIAVMGYGAERPVSDDPARNRRVEIFIAPAGEVRSRGGL